MPPFERQGNGRARAARAQAGPPSARGRLPRRRRVATARPAIPHAAMTARSRQAKPASGAPARKQPVKASTMCLSGKTSAVVVTQAGSALEREPDARDERDRQERELGERHRLLAGAHERARGEPERRQAGRAERGGHDRRRQCRDGDVDAERRHGDEEQREHRAEAGRRRAGARRAAVDRAVPRRGARVRRRRPPCDAAGGDRARRARRRLPGGARAAAGRSCAPASRRCRSRAHVPPISFFSAVWFPLDGAAWVTTTADIFPLKHIVDAFTGCFLAGAPDGGFAWRDLAVIAAWGIAGLAVATRRLRREAAAG